jgi:AraC-like DNA-binding protein
VDTRRCVIATHRRGRSAELPVRVAREPPGRGASVRRTQRCARRDRHAVFIIEYTGQSELYRGLERLIPQIGSGAFRSTAPEAAIEAEELAWNFVGRSSVRVAGMGLRVAPGWLRRVADEVRAGCTGRCTGASLTRFAANAGVHPVYLARVFRRHFGASIGQYLLRA